MKPLQLLDHRLPNWIKKDLIKRTCPFCRNDGQCLYIRPDELPVNYCDNCGTFFVSEAPSEQALNNFYLHYASHRHPDGPCPKDEEGYDPKNDYRVREILSNLGTQDCDIRGRSVLDVGCGTGRMLYNFLMLGADVYGVDLDPEAPRIAAARYGIDNVRQGTLANCDNRVDVLLMLDFIEHPLRPLDDLKRAVGLLNPGGLLVFWTPDATFADVEESPVCFRVDLEHMQYLTAKSCRFLSQTLNLEVLHLETVGFPNLTRYCENDAQKKAGSILPKKVRAAIARILGQRVRRAVRALLSGSAPSTSDLRDGRYHLFCILRAP